MLWVLVDPGQDWTGLCNSCLGEQHSSGAFKEKIFLADVLDQQFKQQFSTFVDFLPFLFKQTIWWQNSVVFKVARGWALTLLFWDSAVCISVPLQDQGRLPSMGLSAECWSEECQSSLRLQAGFDKIRTFPKCELSKALSYYKCSPQLGRRAAVG